MNIKNLYNLYREKVDFFSKEKQDLHTQVVYNSYLRIAVFLITLVSIYFSFNIKYLPFILFILGAWIFIYLVKRHIRLKYSRDFKEKLIHINEKELACLDKKFKEFDTGDEFIDNLHPYCQDIDLFGKGSFFQYLNRTALISGKKMLAQDLLSNSINGIIDKQGIIKELADKLDWRQEFNADGQLIETEAEPDVIISWFDEYKKVVPSWSRMLVYGVSIISIVLIILFIFEFIPEGIILIWLFVGLAISSIFLKKINALQADATKILGTFKQFGKLLERIENEKWSHNGLLERIDNSINQGTTPSAEIHAFSKLLNSLDQRSNFLTSIFTNAFFLRDIYISSKIDNWVFKNRSFISSWFDLVAYFDMQTSYGTFAFNHPQYDYPEISSDNSEGLSVSKLGHPLIQNEKVVLNDFKINNEEFFIITGANMAGKSTFLRTVSLAIVMANCGLPIFGRKSVYHPIKLITSMRTTDSLSDDESYFFSELKRLRYIVDTIKEDDYFIILDEILKGTNSIDKAKGSAKFIERLVKSKSTGIIATHDLSLCDAEDKFPDVRNYYFDAEIINDELSFDYKMKKGICQNMNASFLLRKMKII